MNLHDECERRKARRLAMATRPKCENCGKNVASRPRGLCSACYFNPKVRDQHRTTSGKYEEPTMTELEATIAEQMKCLPAWWENAERHMND